MNLIDIKVKTICLFGLLFSAACEENSHSNHKAEQSQGFIDATSTSDLKILDELKSNSSYFLVKKNNGILTVSKVYGVYGSKNKSKDQASRIKNKIQNINLDIFFNDGAESVIILVIGSLDFSDSEGYGEVRHIPVYEGFFSININNTDHTYSVKYLFSDS